MDIAKQPNLIYFESCTWYRDHWIEDRLIQRTATSHGVGDGG